MSTILGASSNNQGIIDKVNSAWNSTGGVIFGGAIDPFKERFQRFTDVVTNVVKGTTDRIKNTYDYIMGNNKVTLIDTEEKLNAIPAIMQPHILTYAPIREQFLDDKIYGFGIDPACLPSEDVVGRLISNGFVEETMNEDGEMVMPDAMEWEWKCSDPDFKIEELDDLDASRLFIDRFMQEQMKEDGDMNDPTDYADGGKIGELK